MKRSNEVVRDILLLVEEEAKSIVDGKHNYSAFETSDNKVEWLTRPGTDRDSVIHHWKLLIDEGLVDGETSEAFGGSMTFSFSDLTWAGHDFLDMIRQEPVWEEMTKLAKKNGIDIKSATLGMLSKIAPKAVEMLMERG